MGKAPNLLNKIRVYSIFIIAILLIISSILTTGLSLDNKQNTIKNTELFDIYFEKPKLDEILMNGKTYTQVILSNCLSFSEPGKPSLPMYPIKILLPLKFDVSHINVFYEDKIEIDCDIKNKPIIPQQDPIKIGFKENTTFKIDESVYCSSNPVVNSLYSSKDVSFCRGYKILSLFLNPINYIPASGKLFYYPKMSIEIRYEKTNEISPFLRNNIDDKKWVEKLVINPEETNSYSNSFLENVEYENGLCNSSDNYDYIIITTSQNGLDDWETNSTRPYNWTSLMNKHTTDYGYNCTLVTIEEITACLDYWNDTAIFNDTPAKIREFCKDAYIDWNTSYILIGGDDEWIPAREMDYAFESDVDSDIYWSNLDSNFNDDQDNHWGEENDSGFDLYAELYIGRIPCDEPQDVSNWLNKSFYYTNSNDIDYLDNAGFYGGDTGWLTEGDDLIEFSAIDGTSDWTGPIPGAHGNYPNWLGFLWGFQTWNENNIDMPFNLSVKWTAEPANPGWQGGNLTSGITGFKNAINNDQATLISGIAHANQFMSLDIVSTTWESDYHNTKPFFIHDYGCHCGDMDAADDGVLHSMLFHSDTELAFACVYNTGYGWGSFHDTNSSSALQQKLFWDYFFDLGNNSASIDNWSLGKAMAYSKDTMAPTINWTYAGAPGSWRGVIQGCLLFGDPAQRIKAPYIYSDNSTIDISNENPSNLSINQEIGNITLSIDLIEPDEDFVNITFSTNASGSWNLIGYNNSQQNGTYSQNYHFNNFSTIYYWRVNVTDILGESTPVNNTYQFTTRSIHTLQKPLNFSSKTINRTAINLTWSKGENATHTYIERNLIQNWTKGEGIEIYNNTGTYFVNNNLSPNTRYYYKAWSWDSIDNIWNNTNVSSSNIAEYNNFPIIISITPENESTGISKSLAILSVNISDLEGDRFNWTIETSPDIGNDTGINTSSGIKTCNISNLDYSSTYYWFVNFTETNNETCITYTYHFVTEDEPTYNPPRNSGNSYSTTTNNNPPNTPNKPKGNTEGYVDTSYSYTSKATDIDGDNIKYQFDWGDGNMSEWSKYQSSDTNITMSHIWSKEGSCEIKVIAMDETGDESSWSDILKINIYKQITLNEEIEIELNISKNNIVNESINFNLSTTNLEDNNLLFNWDFGDGTNSIEKQPDHKYSQSGTYTITLIISDENGNVISNTSYQVTITESSESIINEMEITEKKQKNNYIALFALSLIFITLFGALVLFSKKISKVYSKNYYGRNYNQRRLGLSNKTHSYFLSHKNRSIDKSAYNFDLKTSKTRKISANFTQSNSSKHPKDSEQKLRSYIDDILSKYDEKK